MATLDGYMGKLLRVGDEQGAAWRHRPAGPWEQTRDFKLALEAVTGEPWTPERIAKTGERITNLQRVFSLKCGIMGADDVLPKKLPRLVDEGSHAGKVPNLAVQLAESYRLRGWHANGRPTRGQLEELAIAEIAGEF